MVRAWILIVSIALFLVAGSCLGCRLHACSPLTSPSVSKAVAQVSAQASRKIPSVQMYWRAFQEPVRDGSGGKRFLRPAEVVALGGDVVAGGSFTGIPVDVPRTRKLRDDIRAARKIAAKHEIEIRFYLSIRPDHYVELKGAEVVPGFRDSWMLRVPREEYLEDARRFESRGWKIAPAGFVSRSFMERIQASTQDAPAFYGPVDSAKRTYKINGVLTDMRNADYRRWQLDWLEALIEFVEADGAAVGLKTGWHAFPMHYPKASPDGRYGGPLSSTRYRRREYEASTTAWVREASQRGIRVFVQDSTPGAGGAGSWFDEEFNAAISGRFKPIPLPSIEEISERVRRKGL